MRPCIAVIVLLLTTPGWASPSSDGAATRPVLVDPAGVVRWRDNGEEVALFGANYCVMSGSDYRMAGLVSPDRKRMIDEDMAHFARMGWTALRLCSWGDWENSDREGNLVVNDHVDLLDYVIAKARERGIYMLLTPIHTYDPRFADQMDRPSTEAGFSRYFDRKDMGVDKRSIAAQARYIGQLLDHVNPYTGVALKNEPAILFVEVINEPVHHPQDLSGSVDYINTLVDAVRGTGSRQITFFNLSQDFAIADALRKSKVDGVSFGWYPSGLVAGHLLRGNFLPSVDAYPDMLMPALANRPRIVYEFDQPDLLTGYLYPAMARTFRSVGAQLATMFAYDMLETAPFNLGWQTHYLNLVHTPRKAVSAVIAAEAMRRLPSRQPYGRYPETLRFGDFRVSYDEDLSELNALDAYMNAGTTRTEPRSAATLQRIVGYGTSPLVAYEGTGAYFADKVREGLWRLEIYPDEVLVDDPFAQPQPTKVVSRLLNRSWPITVNLPDLGPTFHAQALKLWQPGTPAGGRAVAGTFQALPGIWILSRGGEVDPKVLPARLHRVGIDEYHVNEPREYADQVLPLSAAEYPAGERVEIRVRIASNTLPDSVALWVRPVGTRRFSGPLPMTRLRGSEFAATVDAEDSRPGLYEYEVSATTGTRTTSYPGAEPGQPGSWPFRGSGQWTYRVTPPEAAIRLLSPERDVSQLSFVRPGEQYRASFFRILPGEFGDAAALRLELPDLGADTPERYAAALYVGAFIAERGPGAANADTLHLRLRAVGESAGVVGVTLIEKDGSSWTTDAVAPGNWTEVSVPTAALRFGRSTLIPSPFPGLWNYWRPAPVGRGGPGDHVRVENVERLELVIERRGAPDAKRAGRAVDVESVWLSMADARKDQRP